MATESRADLVGMFLDWDRARFAGGVIPCAYDGEYVEALDAVGRGPSVTCAGERKSKTTAILYGESGLTLLVTAGDTLDRVVRQSGDEEGAFLIKTIVHDGTGSATLVLEEV